MNGRPTRDRILDAAREELAAHGYNGTSTRGVARRAQVDIRLIHHYFDSRSHLLRTALQTAQGAAGTQEAPRFPMTERSLPDAPRRDTCADAARLTERLRTLWNTDPLGRRALVASALTDGPTGSRLVSFITGLLCDQESASGSDRDEPEYGETGRAVVTAHMLGLAVLCESGALHRLVAASGEATCQADEFSLESQLDAVLAAVSAAGGLDAGRR
ncbi:helix-turn-helix domain-containing protein [Streptomyces sp. NPDC001292]|uniref:helix-turn-helix domain-containing protein n=1 Tax=Streptomyces sp. NPDC001292 TaxID=3364558 RepID=UPI0036BA7E0A